MLFDRILCPVDFSPHNRRPLEVAAELAETHNGKLFLVHVLEGYPGIDLFYDKKAIARFDKEVADKASAYLESLHPWSKGKSKVAVESIVLHGHPAEQVCAFAKKQKIDVIVLNPHGQSSSQLKKMFMGSTHERILQMSPCAVLSVTDSRKS